jgi:N-methylhydantoinase B/oxoprolinase/acetone carboxylase alpha subunit
MNQQPGNVLLAMALAMPLVVALTGCAGKKVIVRASSQMCVAHGGRYSQETKQCTFAAATTVSGQKACQDLDGVYLPEQQWCQFDE